MFYKLFCDIFSLLFPTILLNVTMTIRKRKHDEASFVSNPGDPTAMWRPKIRPNKGYGGGFAFSRSRSRSIDSDDTQPVTSLKKARTGKEEPEAEPNRFQEKIKRLKNKSKSSSNSLCITPFVTGQGRPSKIDLNERRSRSRSFDAASEMKQADGTGKHQDTTSRQAFDGEEDRWPLSPQSVGKSEKTKILSKMPSRAKAIRETSTRANVADAALHSSSNASNKSLQKTDKGHHSIEEVVTKSPVLVRPIIPPDTCRDENEGAESARKKQEKHMSNIAASRNECTNKKNRDPIETHTEEARSATNSNQAAVPASDRKQSDHKGNGNESESCSKENRKRRVPKIPSADNEEAILDEVTPFFHPKIFPITKKKNLKRHRNIPRQRNSPDKRSQKFDLEQRTGGCNPKDLDHARNDEEYGCNYRHINKYEEFQLPSSPPSLLYRANLKAISRRESTTIDQEMSCGQVGDDGPNASKTKLIRHESEVSTKIMGLSPSAEIVDIDASVKKLLQDQTKSDPNEESSFSDDSDDYELMYYSKRIKPDYQSMTRNPKQLLGDFEAVATSKGSADVLNNTMTCSMNRNHCFKNDETKIGTPKEADMSAESSDEMDRNFANSDATASHSIPKTILQEKQKNARTRKINQKHQSISDQPARHSTAKLDEITVSTLAAQTKNAKSKTQKRESNQKVDGSNDSQFDDALEKLVHFQHSDSDVTTAMNGAEDEDGSNSYNTDEILAVLISDAGNANVNGLYELDGSCEGCPKYVKIDDYKGKKCHFCLYKCYVNDNTQHWFISIVPRGKEPGTVLDTSFYSAPATAEQYQDLPPLYGWISVQDGTSPPPRLAFANLAPTPISTSKILPHGKSGIKSILRRRDMRERCNTASNMSRKLETFGYQEHSPLASQEQTNFPQDDDTTFAITKPHEFNFVRNKARRVSLESPPRANGTYQSKNLLRKKNIASQQKNNAERDSSSDCKLHRSQYCPPTSQIRRRLVFDSDDDSSGSSSTLWHRKSIESNQRREKCKPVHSLVRFAKGISDGEDKNIPSSSGPAIRRSSQRLQRNAKITNHQVLGKFNKQTTNSNSSDMFEDSNDIFHDPSFQEYAVVTNSKSPWFNANSISSPGSTGGTKKVSTITCRSICCILILLCICIVLWAGEDECNRITLRSMKKLGMIRPRIRFSENPSLSLLEASQMQGMTME